MERRKIKNKYKLIYLPLAIIQWVFFTIIFSGIGGIFIFVFSMMELIISLFMLNKEDMQEAIYFLKIPIILPFYWWYDYFTKGEIGPYD